LTAAAQQAYMARLAAMAREKIIWETTQNSDARLKLAQQAYERGEIKTAAHIYVRLALARPANESSQSAKKRLKVLAEEALAKQDKIDAMLTGSNMQISPHELYAERGNREVDDRVAAWENNVRLAFEQYDRLIDDYEDVPGVGNKIKSHVNRQRRRIEVAAVLNEPKAKALIEVAEEHEAEDHVCCAYWVYRQAAQLAPAPSGRKAQARLAELEKDPKTIAAAEACREMQQCHQLYARAERIKHVKPERARELFAEIVQRASSDSEVFRAAQQQLADTMR
jgi:hypothetical protein